MDGLRYVTRKGTEQPVGHIVSENDDNTTTVSWGVSDRTRYMEDIPSDEIVPYKETIVSGEEIQIRQAKESGAHFKIEGDSNG